jgi:hypothetical protein
MGKFGADWPNGRRVADDSPVVLDLRLVPEPETVFFVPVGMWSDGTPAPVM